MKNSLVKNALIVHMSLTLLGLAWIGSTIHRDILDQMSFHVAQTVTDSVEIGLLPRKQELQLAPLLSFEPLGKCQVTSYRSIDSQTDDSPFWTSIGVHTNPYMVAVSQDLLKSGRLHYGDLVFIEGVGFKHIGDAMNIRHKKSFDVWVSTLKQEQDFHKTFKGKSLSVWLVKRKL